MVVMERLRKITFGEMREAFAASCLLLRLQVQPPHRDQRRSMA